MGREVKRLVRPLAIRVRDFLIAPLATRLDEMDRRQHRVEKSIADWLGTDRLLLQILDSMPPHTAEIAALPVSVVPISADCLLSRHPAFPYFFLDANDDAVTPRILLGDYDRDLERVFKRLIVPGSRVLEIGAGCGYHSLTIAAALDRGTLQAFENDPHRVRLLQRNVNVWRLNGSVSILRDREALATALRSDPFDLVRIETAEVPTVVLDELPARLSDKTDLLFSVRNMAEDALGRFIADLLRTGRRFGKIGSGDWLEASPADIRPHESEQFIASRLLFGSENKTS